MRIQIELDLPFQRDTNAIASAINDALTTIIGGAVGAPGASNANIMLYGKTVGTACKMPEMAHTRVEQVTER